VLLEHEATMLLRRVLVHRQHRGLPFRPVGPDTADRTAPFLS
jgi:hypothetical protein